MRVLSLLIVLAASCSPAGARGADSADSAGDQDRGLSLVVMDPLALPLSCPCVEGYAQRDYDKLAEYLSERLGRPVHVTFAESFGKALAKERWACGVDSVGSTTLANLLAMTKYGGAIAACGLAGGMDLPTSVAPFILRGVSLLGIDSVQCPQPLRREAWQRLARDLDKAKLAAITREVGFADVVSAGGDILAGKLRGRTVVRIGGA